jgi:ABC-type multidrug transport system ATPase subunit
MVSTILTSLLLMYTGAGKTSLLNILAGRAGSRSNITICADVRLNNYRVDPTSVDVRKQIAFVAQDGSLQVTSTPRESIRFSAKLRLPISTTDADIETLTTSMLSELGLDDCADTIVGGGQLAKGISGGQRKRTSVGVELVTNPALVFLDEPTSGLDSFSAVQLCQVLKKVANAGSSVLFTIHQPSSEIFNSFDHLILLNKGHVMYEGPVAAVPAYFGARNHPNPENYNPADWIMKVAQSVELEQLEDDGFFPEDERKVQDVREGGEKNYHNAIGITTHSVDEESDVRSVGFVTELSWLFHREVTNFRRDRSILTAKFGQTTFLSILIGLIFFDVGETDSSVVSNVSSRFGALVIIMLISMFGTSQDALAAFPSERPLFLREYSTNHYSVLSYLMSRFSMEAVIALIHMLCLAVPAYFMIDFQVHFLEFYFIFYALAMASTDMAVMLGSALDDPKVATELLPLLLTPQLLFAGFFVAAELIPTRYIS